MSSTATGQQAEAAAAAYLVRQGCRIRDLNWRTRWCEVDVVAERAGVVYFCEVKYRSSARQGGGLDYITPQKLRQMAFAARFWVARYGWTSEYQLAAIEVSGPGYRVTAAVKNLST